jgi:hypothetical protein
MKKLIIILISSVSLVLACTSAVISGKVTPDGRALLWKHRDTGSLENKLVYVDEGAYAFMGIANVNDTTCSDIWMGTNETGFSIMNAASYNINAKIPEDLEKDTEGRLMRLALESCRSVNDFEELLNSAGGEWGLAANFGVIDAEGNAAIFETGYDHYIKYDVNDPDIAPDGYLIRTNYSVSGKTDRGQGYIRYDATAALFARQKLFTPEFIIKEATRNMNHGAMKNHIGNMRLPRNRRDRTLVAFQDYIVRYWSASVAVMQGVLPDEDPGNATIWTIMGFPLTAMATPVFFRTGPELPDIIAEQADESAPLMAEAALELKKDLFPLTHDDHENYLDMAFLMNRKRDGYLQIIDKKEDEIIKRFKAARESNTPEARQEYYGWLEEYVKAVYRDLKEK